ncbi:MAG: phosphatase PAP2 family protein [Erysipelotrichaceae bacterium]|nr:phosphatase PAP2 family protein [Erysipelotrichaceae bacterium]MDY5251503.1 phosphatase PAP2 family protein [Erysipelotrichaceae bacterium]
MNINFFDRKKICLLVSIVVMGMSLGAFFDYGLSQNLYQQQSRFALFFAAYGQLPFNIGFAMCGTMMLMIANNYALPKRRIIQALGLILNLTCFLIGTISPTKFLAEYNIVILMIQNVALLLIVDCLVYQYLKDVEVKKLESYIKFVFIVLVGQLILVNVLKLWWGRPRMRMIVANDDAYFLPWFRFDHSLRTLLLVKGIPLEEFKSFPSGHTACASCILIYALLPLLKSDDNKHLANGLFALGMVYIVIVALSRIVAGAHFLSDVTGGFACCILIIYVAYRYSFETK